MEIEGYADLIENTCLFVTGKGKRNSSGSGKVRVPPFASGRGVRRKNGGTLHIKRDRPPAGRFGIAKGEIMG